MPSTLRNRLDSAIDCEMAQLELGDTPRPPFSSLPSLPPLQLSPPPSLSTFLTQVVHVLDSLEKFFREVAPEVEGISGEERDTATFMRLMSVFNRVRGRETRHH